MEEIFSNVEDITDPSLMDHILIRLEEIQSEDEEFMQILLSKQNEMVITWEQPWYQESNCITRPLNQSNNKEISSFRSDSISYDEDKKIHKNWKKFQRMYEVPNKPICLARWRNKEKCRSPTTPEEFVRRFVISFLARGLERNLYQVYKHVVTRYGSPNKGYYSKYEENVISVCSYNCPQKAVPYLSAILSREPRGIYKRLMQMSNGKIRLPSAYNITNNCFSHKHVFIKLKQCCSNIDSLFVAKLIFIAKHQDFYRHTKLLFYVVGKPDKKKLKWTLSLATKFLNLLLEYTGESLQNLKQKKIEKAVWLKLEKDIDQHFIHLQSFWYDKLHIQLFITTDVKLNELRRKVFKKLQHYPYKVWTDIRWKEIAMHFSDGFSHRFLYRICWNVVRKFQGYLTHPLVDVINYGIQQSRMIRNKRLRTLLLNNNQKLEIIRYTNT